MPFPAGTTSLCTQGNSDTPTHNGASTRHALDFDAETGDPVSAALAGRVGYINSGCATDNAQCGGGFGNYVKLDHGGGYYTLYAHLDTIAVSTGQEVGRAAKLGTIGLTGATSGSHLHFSLHAGDPSASAIGPTIPFTMRARDVDDGSFADRASGSFVCALPGGRIYESDNACAPQFDGRGDAKPITGGVPYRGEFCQEGDTDFFSFPGGPGGFEAKITASDQSMSDCSCAILREDGQPLAEGGPEGYHREDNYNGGQGCACSMTSRPHGSYFLKIYSQMPGVYVMQKTQP